MPWARQSRVSESMVTDEMKFKDRSCNRILWDFTRNYSFVAHPVPLMNHFTSVSKQQTKFCDAHFHSCLNKILHGNKEKPLSQTFLDSKTTQCHHKQKSYNLVFMWRRSQPHSSYQSHHRFLKLAKYALYLWYGSQVTIQQRKQWMNHSWWNPYPFLSWLHKPSEHWHHLTSSSHVVRRNTMGIDHAINVPAVRHIHLWWLGW